MPPVETIHVNGFELIEYDRGDIEVWDGGLYYGAASPWIITDASGDWYARRHGESAIRVSNREAALAYLTEQPKRDR